MRVYQKICPVEVVGDLVYEAGNQGLFSNTRVSRSWYAGEMSISK